MSPHAIDPLSPHALFARAGSNCKECPQEAPSCDCPSGTTCMMTAQSCNECASVNCVKTSTGSSSGSQESSSSGDGGGGGGGGGTNAGAIAGGVIGGLAVVGIITFLIWWFVIRKKRQQQSDESEKSSYAPRAAGSAASGAQSRKSTHSIASTVLTRASNVIQIAYIPGVTNRSPPDTPLVPPVPPLPGASADQHFFMPGDLRDSSWSDMTTDRRSMANTLRSSVATTIYRNDAIVSPIPAQQVTRTRAAMVNVQNGASPQTLGPDAPAVPAITQSQLAKAGVTDANNNSSIVGRAVTAKPVMVKTLGKKNNAAKSPVQPIAEQPESSPEPSSSSSLVGATENNTPNNAETTRRSKVPTVIEDSPAIIQSPFNDQAETPTETDNKRNSAFLDGSDASTKRHSGAHPPRGESPFADANEVK
ncbi:uncharacterized protein APUU_30217S [Aspergillus puulaauensis]|uniref:Membrane anchor Opy2 N-terminal domain-containing protein n=1 Tax=Aspergillus puulaauensis TaxID=1220207 RepID=A0A7R7XIM7_9EURO|nr:uncharacterized protein APUU_30217S [Aspergillus puulaauensis]BCS21992.1 hypothetical protein APUU_30217S [Aspergillus puulaauensis]